MTKKRDLLLLLPKGSAATLHTASFLQLLPSQILLCGGQTECYLPLVLSCIRGTPVVKHITVTVQGMHKRWLV